MKHLLLKASLLLITGNLFAQLHVSPNTTANRDSYVFANDVVLYVEDDIHLVANNNVDTKASVYLRGSAQLIQGDKTTSTNSGDGQLSVWQRGWANAYDYNYWASPVGDPLLTPVTGNTNFGITKFYDVMGGTHPTHSLQAANIIDLNGTSNPLVISRRWIYTLRGSSTYSSWVYINSTDNLNPGEGFTMKGTRTDVDAHDQLYDFRGRPNDGNISVPVAMVGTDSQFTLTGNPYPSALDLRDFIYANDDIEAEILFWDQDRTTNSHILETYEGGYGVWVPEGGVNVGDGSPSGSYAVPVFQFTDGTGTTQGPTGDLGGYFERRFAPIGQGFMIKGAVPGTATFTNSMRRFVPQGQSSFSEFRFMESGNNSFEGNNPNTRSEPEYMMPTVRFHVEIDDTYIRDMVLAFSDETTNRADRGYDGMHPSVINSGDVYWKLENTEKPYVIQARPFDVNGLVPLGLKVKSGTNNFVINVVEMNDFSNNMFLYDSQNKIYQKLDIENKAIINHSGDARTIENRYYIVFKRGIHNNGQGNNNNSNNGQAHNKKLPTAVDVFQNNRLTQLEIHNFDQLEIKKASVFDMRGKMVLNESGLGSGQKHALSTANLSSGTYLVKLTTTEKGVLEFKIVIK